MSKKSNKRSVGIQSTDFFNIDNEPGLQFARLQKKTGFRNLLQQSVTVRSQDFEEVNENFGSAGVRKSKGVQAVLENEYASQQYRSEGQSLEFSFSKKHSNERDDESRATSEMMRVIEQGTGSSNAGTSRMTSGVFSYMSISSQMNDTNLQRQEGSLAFVYSYGEKASKISMTSTFPYFYGSQGSRRLSDETVLLIEDYQSYDQANVAGMQDLDTDRRSVMHCCGRKKSRSTELLTKPIPIIIGKFEEVEEIVCRICHEGEGVEQLIQPCLCKGSIGCVHASCLKIWLEQSNTNRCELCNYPYAIRQTKKYSKCVSIRVFYKTVIDRRALTYDIISCVVITPLTLVGVAMCIQASAPSSKDFSIESSYQMGYVTRIGMIMLSGTIMVAYGVWLYSLISFHYKSWKSWYSTCFDVEVIPVRMTSEERLEATRRLNEEMNRRQQSRERGSLMTAVVHSHSFYQRRVSIPAMLQVSHLDRILQHLRLCSRFCCRRVKSNVKIRACTDHDPVFIESFVK